MKLLWAESLANPGGIVSDIRALADIAKEAGIPLVIDNTMATPYLCQPIQHGADIVVHSVSRQRMLALLAVERARCARERGERERARERVEGHLSKSAAAC